MCLVASRNMLKSHKKLFLLFLSALIMILLSFRVGVNAVFWIAYSNQNSNLIKLSAKLGADINGRDNGRTALIYAVEANEIQIVQTLLELGADPNISYPDGVTPLEAAEGENFNQVANLLLKYGAKRN